MKQEDFVTEEALEGHLGTKVFGKKIYYKEEIDSTNTEARRQAAGEGSHGLLVIAEKQTMGKGRRGRSWSSPKGTGIWMSLLLRPKMEPEKASMLTLVAALSVADAIAEATGLEASIKWPNDIVVNDRKVCGILTEMGSEAGKILYVIVGIGMNVNTREFPEEIRETATSLFIERKKKFAERQNLLSEKTQLSEEKKQVSEKAALPIDESQELPLIKRNVLAAKVLEKLEENYNQFMQSEDLEFLSEDYNKKLVNKDRQVKIIGNGNGAEEVTGTARGINKKGELLVETEEGLLEVRSGEVSVRGLYGYV